MIDKSVAVIVPCHNYARFLPDAINSVLGQTLRPAEIVVVDDASTDRTIQVAQQYADQGVRYLRVEHHCPYQTRRAGMEATESDVVCFLDADDLLEEDYLESGLCSFDDPRVGIVYSDMHTFGGRLQRIVYPDAVRDADAFEEHFQTRNCMHSAALVRREALQMSQAFEFDLDKSTHEDWFVWRKVIENGWQVRKQVSWLRHRQHSDCRCLVVHPESHFQKRGMRHETVTLFIPLSGRHRTWPQLSQFLERQDWPHDQIKLVLCDTGQDAEFSAMVRLWAAASDYADVHAMKMVVGPIGLADSDRRALETRRQVQLAVARIYNRMLCELTSEFVWIIEDDVIPPLDACKRLLNGFDKHIASVALPARSPYHEGYIAWDEQNGLITQSGSGLETVGGNGFCCAMLRRSVLRQTRFTHLGRNGDFDAAFYDWLSETEYQARMDWSVECNHVIEHR